MLLYLAFIDDPGHYSKFEELYHNHKDRLLAIAYSILNDRYEAEDAVHNAFISIAKNMDKIAGFDPDRALGYITVITRNAAYDILRKKKVCLPYDEDILPGESVDDIEIYIEKEEYDAAVDAIRSLNNIYRPVLYLHYVEGQTAKDIAKLLNRPLRTVKQQLVRGKKILLKRLKEKGINE